MADKKNQQTTFGIRLPDLAKGTSLPEIGGLIEAICAAMVAVAACPPEQLRVTTMRMGSPLEVQFRGDRRTADAVRTSVESLATRNPAATPKPGARMDQARGELADELGRLAKRGGGSIELRVGTGKWRKFGEAQLKTLALGCPGAEPLRHYHTSLAGLLEQVTVESEKQRFRIRDSATGRNIQCGFPESMLNRVKEALPHRVYVSGVVRCQANGGVESMEAEDFEILPADVDVPLTQLQPLDITGGQDAAGLVERLRNGR